MFNYNLKKYRELKNYTQEQIANSINNILGTNYKKSSIYSWERNVSPKVEIISAIAEILNIPEQFLFDDSDNAINKVITKKAPQFKEISEHTKRVPLIDGYIGAGSCSYIDNIEIAKYIYIDRASIKRSYSNSDISALTVIGDSMSPYVNPDDVVLFSAIEDGIYNLNDGKYIIRTINGTMVKNLTFKSNGNIVISSCNSSYASEEINKTESQDMLDILGIVVGRVLKS